MERMAINGLVRLPVPGHASAEARVQVSDDAAHASGTPPRITIRSGLRQCILTFRAVQRSRSAR